MDYVCKVCGSKNMVKVLDLGSMPNANGLVTKEQLKSVKSYPLACYWCSDCTFFQQVELVDRSELFGSHYVYSVAKIKPRVEHIKVLAQVMKKNLKSRNFAVVVGSNDGTEIAILKEHGGFEQVLGVEPTANLAKIANDKGHKTINKFFGSELAAELAAEYGPADLVMANNVFAHIPDPKDMLLGMKRLAGENGTISIEVHWLRDFVKDFQIDTIYAEHYYIWNLRAFSELAHRCELKIVGVQYLPKQLGGSVRVLLRKNGSERALKRFLLMEEKAGLYDEKTMRGLQTRADERKREIRKLVSSLKGQNKRVSIWTVPAKVATLLNFCGITNEDIEYAYDSTPEKIGRHIPKANILVKDEKLIEQDMPDYLIMGAWNYIDYGKKKMSWYLERGGKLVNLLTCEVISKP